MLRLVFMLLVLNPLIDDAFMSSALSQDQSGKVDFCLNGVIESATKLRSGNATIKGTLRSNFLNQPENNFSGPVEGRVAYDGKKVRYDISRPGWVVEKASIVTDLGSAKAKMIKGQITKRFSSDGEKVTIWNSDQPLIAIGRLGDFTDQRTTEHFDFRCPTVFDPLSIGRGWSLEFILNRFKTEFLPNPTVVDVNGIWTITWTGQDSTDAVRWLLFVDTKKDFVPTKYLCESAKVKDMAWVKEWEVVSEWAQISKVWVPIHTSRTIFPCPTSTVDEEISLDLEWSSVNESVDPDTFTYKSFEVPDEIGIQDSSNGEVIWIKDLPRVQVEEGFKPLDSSRRSWLTTLVASALLIAVLVVGARYFTKNA